MDEAKMKQKGEQQFEKRRDYCEKKYGIPCKITSHGNPIDGYDYSCDYENAPFCCEYCVINGDSINPITGRRVYKKKGDQNAK